MLTDKDKNWLAYHEKLASTKTYDIVSFADLFMQDGPVKVEKKHSVQSVKRSQPIVDHYYDDSDNRADYELKWVRDNCKPATFEQYSRWFKGYTDSGGSYDDRNHKFSSYTWLILQNDLPYLPELYGARSFNLIIPANRSIEKIRRTFHGRCGHSNLFFMRGFQFIGNVSRYSQ